MRISLPLDAGGAAVSPSPFDSAGWVYGLGSKGLRDLDSRNPNDRSAAARALAELALSGGAMEIVVPRLEAALELERLPTVRRDLITALARLGRGERALARAMQSAGATDGPLLARVLGALGTASCVEALAQALGRPPQAEAAQAGLVRAGAAAVPALVALLGDPHRRRRAIWALAEIGSPHAVQGLIDQLEGANEDVRVDLLRALSSTGDRRAREPARRRLKEGDGVEAIAAATVLGSVGELEDVPMLLEAMDRPEPLVQRAAVEALVRIDPDRALPHVQRSFTSDDPDEVLFAVDLVLRHPQPAFVGVLAGIVQQPIRAGEAAAALARLEGGQGVSALIAALGDPPGAATPHLQRELAIALRRWDASVSAESRRQALVLLERVVGDRGLVLRALARAPGLEPALIEGLRDSEAARRAYAALAVELWLGDARPIAASADEQRPAISIGERLARALREALRAEDDPEAFRRMAHAALRVGLPVESAWVASRLDDGATAPEAMWLTASSIHRASLFERRRFGAHLRRSLHAAEPRLRAAAALALGIAGERQAWRALVASLENSDVHFRRAAAVALALLAAGDAQAALAGAQRLEEDAAVRTLEQDALDAARDGHPRPPATGSEVLRVEVRRAPSSEARPTPTTGESTGIPVEALLPDGRWLRIHTLGGGELILPDLPAGKADVRLRL